MAPRASPPSTSGIPAAGAGCHVLGQRVGGEELLRRDFEARLWHLGLTPGAHHEQGDVVAGEALEVGVDAEQSRRAGELDAGFLLQLAGQRLLHRLAPLDAAAGEMPTCLVAVPHQQHGVAGGEHDALRAHGQPAPEAPVALQGPGHEGPGGHAGSTRSRGLLGPSFAALERFGKRSQNRRSAVETRQGRLEADVRNVGRAVACLLTSPAGTVMRPGSP